MRPLNTEMKVASKYDSKNPFPRSDLAERVLFIPSPSRWPTDERMFWVCFVNFSQKYFSSHFLLFAFWLEI